jgi:hypothetical protein
MSQPLFFDLPFRADRVDKLNAIIRGVSIITSGITARGHDLDVDATTIHQMFEACSKKGQIPVKANHKSGVQDITGFITNFYTEGGKLKGDWHILQSFPAKDQILETAERMPAGVGLSAAFIGPDKPVKVDGRLKARCEEVLSIDYVTMPAANPSGLFSANVDTQTQLETKNTMAEPTLADVVAQLSKISERLDAQEALNKEMLTAMNPPSLEELAQMDEQELADLGLTPQDVQDAIAEATNEATEQDGDEGQEAAEQGAVDADGDGDGASCEEGAGVGAGAGASTGLDSRLERVIQYFEARMAADIQASEALENERAETAFSNLEETVIQLKAENEALRLSAKVGGKASKPAIELTSGTTEFTKLVELSMREGKKSHGAAIKEVMAKHPEAYNAYLLDKGVRK